MAFKQSLQEMLRKRLSEKERAVLPSGYQSLGSIAILKVPKALWGKRREIGKAALALIPSASTVLASRGVEGKWREPALVWLAGKKSFNARLRENGCVFEFDVRKTMWSAGNSAERKRIAQEVKSGETVMDFFAGPGDWSVPIAKTGRAAKVIAIEASKQSYQALQKNIALNQLREIVRPVFGKCEKVAPTLEIKADRILLGWLPEPSFAWKAALDCAKHGTIIHYHALSKESELEQKVDRLVRDGSALGRRVRLHHAQFVKSYAPSVNHYDLELEVI